MLVLKSERIFTGKEVIQDGLIIIKDNKILAIGKSEILERYSCRNNDIIDLPGKTIFPGLVNSHIHFTVRQVFGPLDKNLSLSLGDLAFRAARSALCCLRDGITSARDMGHKHLLQWDLKKAVESKTVLGPRIKASRGSIVMSFGHGYLSGHNVNNVEEALVLIRKQASEGADFIKVLGSHDDLPNVKSDEPCVPWFSEDDFKRMAELAHRCGIKITAHANGQETIRRVIEADFDCIEHGIYITEELAAKMSQKGMFLCPTLTGYKQNSDTRWRRGEFWHKRYTVLWEAHRESIKNAVRQNVRIAAGTDNLGDLIEEIRLLTESGMDIIEAFKCATLNGAELLELDRVGLLKPGNLADMIVVDGDPFKDTNKLRNIDLVIKDGEIYNTKALREVIPASPLFKDDPNEVV